MFGLSGFANHLRDRSFDGSRLFDLAVMIANLLDVRSTDLDEPPSASRRSERRDRTKTAERTRTLRSSNAIMDAPTREPGFLRRRLPRRRSLLHSTFARFPFLGFD